MFTGIVEALGTVQQVKPAGPGRTLIVEQPDIAGGSRIGDSIAVNGVCLTLVDLEAGQMTFQLGPETLARSNLGSLCQTDHVNLERSLLPTTRIGGHFVQGHVDGQGEIAAIQQEQDWIWMQFRASEELVGQMIPKGSVAVDGVSLTVVSVDRDRFTIMLIPHTLSNTTLGLKETGDPVNIETDIIGKYVLSAVRKLHSCI